MKFRTLSAAFALVLALFVAVPAQAQYAPATTTLSPEEKAARGVLKALGALVLHEAQKPQSGDGFVEALARAAARSGRDELLNGTLADLFPQAPLVERDAVRSLMVLALDGRMSRDRDAILRRLRQANPQSADGVEIVEFLIKFAQEVDRNRN